jgi:hypothetical protein
MGDNRSINTNLGQFGGGGEEFGGETRWRTDIGIWWESFWDNDKKERWESVKGKNKLIKMCMKISDGMIKRRMRERERERFSLLDWVSVNRLFTNFGKFY